MLEKYLNKTSNYCIKIFYLVEKKAMCFNILIYAIHFFRMFDLRCFKFSKSWWSAALKNRKLSGKTNQKSGLRFCFIFPLFGFEEQVENSGNIDKITKPLLNYLLTVCTTCEYNNDG